MKHHSRYALLIAIISLSCTGHSASANWRRSTTRVVQKTFLDRGAQLKFDPQSINAVAAQGVLSDQALISNGSWNQQNTFSMQTPGQEFVLQLHEKVRGPMPSDVNVALQTAPSEVTLWDAPNRLSGQISKSGQLDGSSGSEASKVNLTFSQTYSVFSLK